MKTYSVFLISFLYSLTCFGAPEDVQNTAPSLLSKTTFDSAKNEVLIGFSGVQKNLAGGPIQVLVLGTSHLSGMKESLPQAHLSLLLDKLTAFSPDIIAIEGLSGISCGILKEYQSVYGDTWKNYCWDPAYVLEHLNITPAQAVAKSHEFIDLPENQATPEKRREMAAYFFAAGLTDSATLQWLQLSDAERIAENGVNGKLKKWLDKRVLSSNESVSIAATLGAKLGLRYLHPMDDHTADIVYHNAPEGMWDVLQKLWQSTSEEKTKYRQTEKDLLGSPQGVLDYYRFLNNQFSQQVTIDADFGSAATLTEKNNIARRYVAWWQSRGLKMAAHVVEATARNPSAKVLVLVGASHKPYFDAYLNQMHDFELVPVNAVLK